MFPNLQDIHFKRLQWSQSTLNSLSGDFYLNWSAIKTVAFTLTE